MVLFNYSTKEITAKIVYYGPGLCGKTTNLQFIYENLPSSINKGKMLSLATKTDRTLFFDFLPIDLGTIRGMKTRLQLYTVPGQVFYNTTRKLVLKGCDGVVFVADSQRTMLEANLESFKNLKENLAEHDMNIGEMPVIIQFNKRDLPDVLSIEELNAALNPTNSPIYEAVATTGIGVHETLKAATRLVLNSLRTRYADDREKSAQKPAKVAAAAAMSAASPSEEVSSTEEHDAPLETTSQSVSVDPPVQETVTMPPIDQTSIMDDDLTLGPDLPEGDVDEVDSSSFDADMVLDTPSVGTEESADEDVLEVVPQNELAEGNNVLELAEDVVDEVRAPVFEVDDDVDETELDSHVLPVAADPEHDTHPEHHENATGSFPIHDLQQAHPDENHAETQGNVHVDSVTAHLTGEGKINLPVTLTIGDRTAHFELTLSFDVKQPVEFSGVNGEGERK